MTRSAAAESDLATLDARIATARAERDDLAREEQRLDDEARSLAAKATEVESEDVLG